MTQDKQALLDELLHRGVANIYPTREKFADALTSGKRLKIYLGVDPTGPSLHMGHAIPMRKLRLMQELGHEVILLIGDFTAMIGDPTDKLATRKQLTRDEVLANCASYKEQASQILRFDGENPVKMLFNSEWLAKMSFADVVELASHFTVQQMMERDMFEKRWQEEKPIGVHEFMYPLMQGFDSVAMDVDVEVGGNDQTFNMLAGRSLVGNEELMQKVNGKHAKEKFVITAKLLTDATGKKMGKSEGNMITLADAPEDMYGKVMSWTDGMIVGGFELCTLVPMADIAKIEAAMKAGENPVVFKKQLAKEVVRAFLGDAAAEQAEAHFARVHGAGEMPEEIPEVKIEGDVLLVDALVLTEAVSSKSDARRQIEQNGVKVNGAVVADVAATVKAGDIVQKGKRFFVKLV